MALPAAALDADGHVDDRLVLTTVRGAEEYLLADATATPGLHGVAALGPGLVVADLSGPLRSLSWLRTAEVIAVHAGSDDQVVGRLADSSRAGVLSRFRRTPLQFRVGAMPGRFELRDTLASAFGWVNDPSDWDLNLERRGQILVAEIGPLHRPKRVEKGSLARLRTSTTPTLATVLVRMADLGPGQVLLDPCCGAGTILVEALVLEPSVRVVGVDLHAGALKAARSNMAGFHPDRWRLINADAGSLKGIVDPGSADRVVANLPFGKQSGSHATNDALYRGVVAGVARALSSTGTAVLLTEDKRRLESAIGRVTELRMIRSRVLEVGGLHPSAYTVARRRSTGIDGLGRPGRAKTDR